MTAEENSMPKRLLTPTELAACVKLFREVRLWSQEQLADIAGLNVRTIQRIEQGVAASLDSRRALARAFGADDIDAFNKPFAIPTEQDIKKAKDKFDQENVTLNAIPLRSGKTLAKLVQQSTMDLSESAFELSREADEAFAALVDYFRDYRDFADDYPEAQKFDVYDELQLQIDALKSLGVSLRYAERKMRVKFGGHDDAEPLAVTMLYVVAFPLGQEPEQFATPKSGGFRL
jgi:transcriptional regulator with XRE-family HTH domain